MASKYNSLEELRRKKALLKKEVSDMESILTFDNAKESLSAFTNGFTDQYLKEIPTEDGHSKIAIKKDAIVKEISGAVKSQISKNSVMQFAQSDSGNDLFQNAVKLGAVTLVGNYARKNMKNPSWKKKILAMALIYLAPYALRFLRKRIEDYQKNQTVSKMEQLI